MTHGSLFSGIGGFDLAAEWMGWENVFHCEWNEFGKKVLKYYWPEAISYHDITKTDFTIHRGSIDILTGGFPCQPYSTAGKRKGKADDRHLWPEMLRAIREIQPRYVVGENVRGLTNWNGGLVFNEVQADLEAEGYEVTPFLLPACGVNAPHRRDRIWFIAYAKSIRGGTRIGKNVINGNGANNKSIPEGEKVRNRTTSVSGARIYTDSNSIGQSRSRWPKKQMRTKTYGNGKASWTYPNDRWPSQSPVCNGDDGVSSRLDSITFSKWRKESIKGGGNAIVPQAALQIFKAIQLTIHHV